MTTIDEQGSAGRDDEQGSAGRDFLVLGGTGRTGKLVAAGLRARGARVRTAAREGADVRFDWDAPGTWDTALAGARAAYVVTPERPDFPAAAVGDFAARAGVAGVRRLVLLSGLSAGYGSVPMLSRETALREALDGPAVGEAANTAAGEAANAGVSWTILRPGAFQQNFAAAPYPAAIRTGELRLPLAPYPGPASAYIDVADIAEVAAAVLTAPDQAHAGRIHHLAGPRALTFPDVFALIAGATGSPAAAFRTIPRADWLAAQRAAGVPEARLDWALETFAALRSGEYARLHTGVRDVLGRDPRPMERYVREAAAAGAWAID